MYESKDFYDMGALVMYDFVVVVAITSVIYFRRKDKKPLK